MVWPKRREEVSESLPNFYVVLIYVYNGCVRWKDLVHNSQVWNASRTGLGLNFGPPGLPKPHIGSTRENIWKTWSQFGFPCFNDSNARKGKTPLSTPLKAGQMDRLCGTHRSGSLESAQGVKTLRHLHVILIYVYNGVERWYYPMHNSQVWHASQTKLPRKKILNIPCESPTSGHQEIFWKFGLSFGFPYS
jgi:hypothetical protein